MLEFSDWEHVKYTPKVDMWYKKINNIKGRFELSIDHYLDYHECALRVTYDLTTLFAFDIFKSFSRLQFEEEKLYCFDDIETAKTYVENFVSYLNRCTKLSAFL